MLVVWENKIRTIASGRIIKAVPLSFVVIKSEMNRLRRDRWVSGYGKGIRSVKG